jgi:hypothetical protein
MLQHKEKIMVFAQPHKQKLGKHKWLQSPALLAVRAWGTNILAQPSPNPNPSLCLGTPHEALL